MPRETFQVDLDELTFIGEDLARPECVLCTAAGDVWVSDWRGGAMRIRPDGTQELVKAADDGRPALKPNGIALLSDGSILCADLGERGGVWRLLPGGGPEPYCLEVNGETLSPRQQIAAVPYAMVAETLLGKSLGDLDDRYVRNNGSFPSPAYDSGYLAYAQGEGKLLDHSIGGAPDDYVVDIQCMWDGDGLAHNYYVGGDADGGTFRGATWDNLLSDTILVERWADDPFCLAR